MNSPSKVGSQRAPEGTIVVEWAPFELADGKDEEGLLAASDAMQLEFLDSMPGFISRELLHEGSSSHWVDLVYWENIDAAMKAAHAVIESPLCASYFSYMTLSASSEADLLAGVSHYNRVSNYAAKPGGSA